MKLENAERVLKTMVESDRFDSYALLVGVGGEERAVYSKGIDENTFFDIASMGKVLVTSTLILRALGEGKLALEDTLPRFFSCVPEDKAQITVRQLLTHTSGVYRYEIPMGIIQKGKAEIAKDILSQPLGFAPGTAYDYSCCGYILLGFIVEKVYGMPLDRAYETLVKIPLGLDGCSFNLSPAVENRVVSYYTENHNGCLVADSICNRMQGVAGNGCSFWTVKSLNAYLQALLNRDERLYKKELFELAERDITPDFADGRGLGYLVVNERYRQTGNLFKTGSFGHCGNTGTSFFIDRERGLYVILLTNATRFSYMRRGFTCPNYDELYGETMQMREIVHNAILEDLKNAKKI